MNAKSEHIYLSKVGIVNFRALGEFEVPIHPGPGLVLLVGQNGLGKTSWFEAIEMALTGSVKRWKEEPVNGVPSSAQHREGVSPPRWSTCLEFQRADGRCITPPVRRSGPEPLEGTHLGKIISDVLAPDADAWVLSEANLSSFLHATHFLPQSVRLRFLSRARRERWDDVLSQVSGFARLRRASQNVGKGTKHALTNMEKEHQKAVEDADEALARWQTDLELLEAAERRRASNPAVLDPEAVRRSLDDIGLSLAPPDRSSSAIEESESLARALREAAGQVSTELGESEDRLAELVALRGIPAGLSHIVPLEEKAERDVTDAESAMEAARVAEVSAGLLLSEISEDEVGENRRLRRAQEVLEMLSDLRECRSRQSEALRSIAKYGTGVEEASVSVGELEKSLARTQSEHDRRKKWESKGQALRRRQREVSDARERLGQLEALHAKRMEIEAEVQRLADLRSRLETEWQQAEQALEAHKPIARSANTKAGEERMRRDALQNAVAVIAANLDAQDISCPVCLHEWVPPGTLLSKAQRAAATDPVLLRAEESAKEANARLDQLRGALEAIEVRLKDAGSHSNRQTAILSSLESEVQRCLDHSLLGGGQELEELDRVVEEEASRLAAEESSWQDSPESGLPPAADQVAALKLSQESLEAGQRRLGEASRGLEVAQETNAELDARSGVLLDLLHEIDPSFDRTEDERTEYEHRRLRSEQRLKEIRGKIATAKERLSKATERINECRESLARATAKKESLATSVPSQWFAA